MNRMIHKIYREDLSLDPSHWQRKSFFRRVHLSLRLTRASLRGPSLSSDIILFPPSVSEFAPRPPARRRPSRVSATLSLRAGERL